MKGRRYSERLDGKPGAGYRYHPCRQWDPFYQRYYTFHWPVKDGVCETCGKKPRGQYKTPSDGEVAVVMQRIAHQVLFPEVE